VATAVVETKGAARKATSTGLDWPNLLWMVFIHLVALAAPFTFSWSGLIICGVLHWITGGLGICLCYHRLLTHRSFRLVKPLEYLFTFFGSLAAQGGALSWVGWHRMHHKFSDEPGDPHSPRDGHLWSHMFWIFTTAKDQHGHELWDRYVPDLLKDPIHRLLHHTHFAGVLALSAALYLVGHLLSGPALGLSWLVWGVSVRMILVYHTTWFVNWASHVWGYRTFKTSDQSRNNWWVALLTYGEGWHNNHHAHQRSARHGMRWWEFDMTYWTIKLLALLRLARDVRVPNPTLAGSR